MGPSESPTAHPENQEGRPKRPKRSARRPRTRPCLLKGCEQRFHSRRARQRYCSADCRKAARRWSRWKAQQRYRATKAGRQKRNGQSQCYRERVKGRKPAEPEAVNEAARVITTEHFFSTIRATGRAATRDSGERGEVPYSTSVRPGAGARWSASGSGNGGGGRRAI